MVVNVTENKEKFKFHQLTSVGMELSYYHKNHLKTSEAKSVKNMFRNTVERKGMKIMCKRFFNRLGSFK